MFQLKGIDTALATERQAAAAGVLEQMRRLRDAGQFPPFNEGNFGGYYLNWANDETLWNMLPVAGNPLDEEELSRLTALSRERLVAYLALWRQVLPGFKQAAIRQMEHEHDDLGHRLVESTFTWRTTSCFQRA